MSQKEMDEYVQAGCGCMVIISLVTAWAFGVCLFIKGIILIFS